ncbi:MAG: DUF721 domain-containing protein [Betaproteobacteria bacterium]|nr:DUF721 domain-containing protein [Betaproteobacteria bacterium]
MKKIGEVVRELAEGDWREHVRQAARLSRLQTAARRIIREAGFGEISCRAGGEEEVVLSVSPAAAAILRQMRGELLARLQKEFPEIKRLRFGIQL